MLRAVDTASPGTDTPRIASLKTVFWTTFQ